MSSQDKSIRYVSDSPTIIGREQKEKATSCEQAEPAIESGSNTSYEDASRCAVIWSDLTDPESAYKVRNKIGAGSYGVVYDGIRMWDRKPVAIKFEPCTSTSPQLRDEYRMYKKLSSCGNFPDVYHFGKHGLNDFFTMDLLGPSLETLFQKFKYLFTVETVAMLGQQMISRLNAAHKKGMIHRDVKPDNFVVAENRVFLIDLAMMKPYQDPRTKQHIPYEENIPVVGTARYMSINTHLGRTQSRRDDFESLWHVLLYFLRGHLPWEGIKADSLKDKNDMILKRKKVAEAEDLCEGFPHEFCELGHYVRNLGFEQNPDCDYMQKLLGQVSTDDMEGRGTIPGYFEKVSNRNGPAPLCSPEVAGSKVVLGKETNRARERSSREEVLQVIQSQPLTWLEELTTWAQIETIRGQDVAYNKQQQETLNNIFQTVSSSVYWLTKSQKTVFTPQYGLSRMRMSRMAERERTPLSKELESVCHVSKKVSTDILREGYSDNVSRLKDLLGTIKNLAELELEHSSCMKEKQVVIRSIGANNQVYHRPDDEETLRQQELAAKRDEVERATTSLGKQSGTQQGPRVAQKHKLTLSPSQQPCKRRSQEKLNTTADV